MLSFRSNNTFNSPIIRNSFQYSPPPPSSKPARPFYHNLLTEYDPISFNLFFFSFSSHLNNNKDQVGLIKQIGRSELIQATSEWIYTDTDTGVTGRIDIFSQTFYFTIDSDEIIIKLLSLWVYDPT